MIKKLQFLGDSYKFSHPEFYGDGITNVFTNFVPRALRFYQPHHSDTVVAFGAMEVAKQLQEISDQFFNNEFDVEEYNRVIKGDKLITAEMWLELKELGYLPIKIKAVKDGTAVSVQTPVMHVETTNSQFFWLGQYLETFISQIYWVTTTAATKSRDIRYLIDLYENQTSDTKGNSWRAHDFGCRGHQGTEGSVLVGMAHLLFNGGSDTTIAQARLCELYHDFETNPVVNATEHSVMCSRGEEDEEKLLQRLLNEYQDNMLSIVIDGFDQDNFVDNLLPKYKEQILARKFPLVIRPDSGDITEVMVKYAKSLDKTFGSTVNSKGFKVLNNVALLWGDGCTYDKISETLMKLMVNDFALDNFLFGVGSYWYMDSTRDTFNMAIKATAIEREDGTIFNTMKKVKSDTSKASLSGLVAVDKDLNVIQNCRNKSEFEFYDTGREIYFFNGTKRSELWSEVINNAND